MYVKAERKYNGPSVLITGLQQQVFSAHHLEKDVLNEDPDLISREYLTVGLYGAETPCFSRVQY